MIIELLGLPRSGKTTVGEKLEGKFIDERFDLVPYPEDNFHLYNRWYAQYIATKTEAFAKIPGTFILARGPNDRLITAKALLESDLIDDKEYNQHHVILKHSADQVDGLILIQISAQESISRARGASYSLMRNLGFLTRLETAYNEADAQTVDGMLSAENLIKKVISLIS